MKCIRVVFLCFVILLHCYSSNAQQASSTAPVQLREGKHNFTLQWLGWEKPGKATISKKTDSTYSIEGEQRNAEGFVTIRGTLKMITPRELLFEGTILTQVKYIYEGKECDRTGTYHFLAKGTRKYWRLQEMANCEGEDKAVDYVDIFF
jgi:hypothetical protein